MRFYRKTRGDLVKNVKYLPQVPISAELLRKVCGDIQRAIDLLDLGKELLEDTSSKERRESNECIQ
jgi:hypothetical protein